MRLRLASILSLLLALQAEADVCRIVWPNAEISIPPLVRDFIMSECNRYLGTTEESLSDCVTAESYGYRAVVTILTDAQTGEKAAERYRACAAGLGDQGGRFHRRKAECIGSSLGLVWRFEFSART
jgi:hypothetical protein